MVSRMKQDNRRRSDSKMPNRIVQLVGPKYVSILRTWVPTLAGWGTVCGVALVHFTDWRLFLDYVPYINGKFKNDD
ncbi:hypothetical protein COCON_G00059300 [Conger conger]|uniref:Cytochrome b-c1 complex subunit 10 n=1 Tax=Conger conger TaxID=82655 RepID=A0A9Q1DRR4_CONCO|nr:hypothetical protein COCON_G00059300 [Conger conger]